METNKSLQEAILRARPSSEKNNQPQDLLFSMASPKQQTYTGNTHHAPLNESHLNLMQSWMNLRSMECKLGENMFQDLSENKE